MLNIALFGAGRIGRIHAANLAGAEDVCLKYVVDVREPSAQALAATHGASVASVDAVFADASVDAVVICSSTDTHADLIVRAAAAGKHLFCEKPVDLEIDRARQCVDAVSRAGVKAMIGFQRRYDPTFRALKTRLVAGEIGDPEVLVITSRDPGAPPLSYIASSGGIFKDMLIHDFDVYRWILDDEAVSVYAQASCLVDPAIAQAGDADTTAVTIRTRKGQLCQINTSRRAAYGYDQRFEVLGSKGLLKAENHRPSEVEAWTAQSVNRDLPEHFFLQRYRAAYADEMAHFIGVLRGEHAPGSTLADGLKALELAEAAVISVREGRAVELASVR
ncbi:inositol 2-dehydrogenase [Paraburkholderia phosphatilytica]|uniref:inositol 2-dehydrogenase n=1 Tax=Paraburkholderia phosphatilytica TaxID=2282883 RepID=UPI000E5132FE|nr:inositol 2-dehydrogenase [Paraburkholderia phosphatilytica]